MRKLLLAATALCALAGIARADIILTPTQVGQSGVVQYNGVVNGNVQTGLTAAITYTLQSVNLANNIWTFGYAVDNTSTLNSRVSTFGFNTTPDFNTVGIIGGTVFTGLSSGNVPQLGNVEFCLTAGANCAGGGGGGVLPADAPATGSFFLDFAGSATNATQIAFTDLYVRYQSIVGSPFGDSGTGFGGPGPTPFCVTPPCNVVPIPGPVVGAGVPGLLAALSGLVGFNYYRRRRRTA